MNILFLDDSIDRMRAFQKFGGTPFFAAFDARMAIDILTKMSETEWDEVWLDHDLAAEHYADYHEGRLVGPGSGTGHDVALWIAEHKPTIKRVIVHSWNAAGAERMEKTLREAGYDVMRRPFQIPVRSEP